MQVAPISSKVLELCALKIEDSCRKGDTSQFEVLTRPLCKVLSLLRSLSAAKVDTHLAIKTCCDLLLGVENAGLEDSVAFKEECINALLLLVQNDVKKLFYHLQASLNDAKNDDGLILNIPHALRLLFFKLPDELDFELLVFGTQLSDDVDIRVADWLNLGLDSHCPQTKVEAIKALWKVCLHVSDAKASAIVEVLMDTFMEESDSDVLAVTIASIWEILFMKPHAAPMLLSEDASYSGMHLWSSLDHVDCKVRHAAILSAARLLLYPTTTLLGQHKLFGILLEIYTSGVEKESTILQTLCVLFEERLQSAAGGQIILEDALIWTYRQAFLDGVPLPSSCTMSSYTEPNESEKLLQRKIIIIRNAMTPTTVTRSISRLQSLLHEEFGLEYSQARIQQLFAS